MKCRINKWIGNPGYLLYHLCRQILKSYPVQKVPSPFLNCVHHHQSESRQSLAVTCFKSVLRSILWLLHHYYTVRNSLHTLNHVLQSTGHADTLPLQSQPSGTRSRSHAAKEDTWAFHNIVRGKLPNRVAETSDPAAFKHRDRELTGSFWVKLRVWRLKKRKIITDEK